MNADPRQISRVTRTKAEARDFYDRISRFYDFFAGSFEQKYRNMALKRLNISKGETVLEVGFGTGYCLTQIANAVGEEGKVYGIDISSRMLMASRRRMEKVGLCDRVELICDDALKMPYLENKYDAVFSSFTIELFDSPEIPMLLAEIQRVLKINGRVGIISISKGDKVSTFLQIYEWLHNKFPEYIDCRPIHVERSMKDAGFVIKSKERVSLFGLPGDIVVGTKPAPRFE